MRLSVITNAFNEGPRVAATCRAFLEAGADEVIVCADGTQDGSCDNLPDKVKVIRNEVSLGCGKSKRRATDASTGDVLLWVDAHQNVVDGDIRAMAQRALGGAIINPLLVNIYYDEQWMPHKLKENATGFWPNDEGILPVSNKQYLYARPEKPRMVGVGLCMSRRTYTALGGWNNYLARHGSQERGMALRAFMAGIDVETHPEVTIGHEFFGKEHPSRNHSGKFRFANIVSGYVNLWHAYLTVCSHGAFTSFMKPWLLSLQGGDKGRMAESCPETMADRDYFHRHCKRKTDDELFAFLNDLLAKMPLEKDPGGASMEPAALRLIQTHARGRCLEFGTGTGGGTKALLEVATAVVSVDHLEQYSIKAREQIEDAEFITCPIDPMTGFYDISCIDGLFDTIVIDGPPGKAARLHSVQRASQLLAPGGVIFVDDAKRDKSNIDSACYLEGFHCELLPTNRGLAKLTRG